MNKPICFLLLIFLLTNLSFGQETHKGLSISMKGGLTLANQYGKDAESETFLNGDSPENFYANNPASKNLKSGFNIGSLLEYRFNRRFSVGVGINYIQKGSKINATQHWNSTTQDYEKVDGKIKWIQNYWTVDLPLKVYFPIKQNELFLQGGLSFDHLINSEERGAIEIAGKEYDYTNDRGANKNEIGFLLGFGYSYLLPNNKDSLILEFIWDRSFGKSYGSDLIGISQKYYNQTFSLNIGYTFKFNRNKK